MNSVADRNRKELENARPSQDESDISGNPALGANSVYSEAQGASVVQVETLGRTGLFVILVMFIVIVAIGILAGYALGSGKTREEAVDTRLGQMNSRLSVVEYDLSKICGALLAENVVEACH